MSEWRVTRRVVLLAVLCGPGTAHAQESPAQSIHLPRLSLEDAIWLGLRHNRTIRGAHLQRIAEKFDLRVVADRFHPQLHLSSRFMAQRDRTDQSSRSELSPNATLLTPYGTHISLGWAYGQSHSRLEGRNAHAGADITLTQPLLRGAGRAMTQAPLRMAQLTEQINRLNLHKTLADTVTRIIFAYRDLLRSRQRQEIAEAALQRTRQLLQVNQALIAAGRMAAFDIVQTEAEIATRELACEQARNTLQAARLALLHLLALDLHGTAVATDEVQASRLEVDTQQAMRQAQALQPAWRALQIAHEQAGLGMQMADNEQLWDLSLVASASQIREHGRRQWQGYAGLQLQIPLTDISRRQTHVHARVNLDSLSLQLEDARQQLEREVGNGVREIDTRWRQLEIARRACELARKKLAIEREKLGLGRSSNFQVLSFENDLRDAQNARLDMEIDYLNAQTELDRTLGTTLRSWGIRIDE